jgi:hypothetical protein
MTHQSSHTHAAESAVGNKNSGTIATRYVFVEMLFALAIAEVAVIASHVVRVSGPWTGKLPVTAHLTLGAILIATSWLGWSASLQRRREERAEHPFSWDFLGLLMDVLLVVFYFILVRQAEITEEAPYRLTPPSAVPEATWLLVIFATYAVWDFVTDVLKEPNRSGPLAFAGLFFASAACSLVCTGLAGFVWRRACSESSGWAVVCLDGALLSLVLLFRVIKGPVENGLRSVFPGLKEYKAFKSHRPEIAGEYMWTLGLVLAYIIFLLVAAWIS